MATGFSPVAGIQWVETPLATPGKWVSNSSCFSPVAGIQWVETFCFPHRFGSEWGVSVPLPGFSGLRQVFTQVLIGYSDVSVPLPGFSGLRPKQRSSMARAKSCFSPVAGIQWVETLAVRTA